MIRMKMQCGDVSSEEQKKADFLKEVEEVMRGAGKGKVAITEAYDQLLKLMGEQDMGQVLQLMHQRAMNILKETREGFGQPTETAKV